VSDRAKVMWILGALSLLACGDDDTPRTGVVSAGTSGASARDASQVDGGAAGASGDGGSAGRPMRRSPLSCDAPASAEVQCGGQTCPTKTVFEDSTCFVPCCVTFQGSDQCGFRGTSSRFTTECVLPAKPDPTCDEVVQFQGCCEPTKGVCGIIGGFAPGCQTTSSFATLPQNPKSCDYFSDLDAGSIEDAGTP
jgi:hypothetical protein